MRLRVWIIAIALLAAGSPAAAQSASDLFNDQQLRELRLSINPRDWELLRGAYRENTYYPADLEWNGLRVASLGVRSRGNSSRSPSKPGLRLDFDRYVGGQEFLGLKSLVLDNLGTDASGIVERVAMRFLERMGIPVPREAHVALYVNDEPAGVYAVVEPIDKRYLARIFGGEGGQVENDGYLFEYKFHFPWHLEYLGPELNIYSLIFEPRTREFDAPVDLWGPIEELTRTIEDDGGLGLTAALAPFLDVEQFVRYVALETFIAEFDGVLGERGTNNFYLYRFEDSQRFQFLTWDRDQAFWQANRSIWQNLDRHALMRRLMEVPELKDVYLNTLLAAAASAAEPVGEAGRDADDERPGWLEAEMERQASIVREPIKSDPARWQHAGSFDQEAGRLIEFARARSAFVVCEVSRARNREHREECRAPDRIPALAF